MHPKASIAHESAGRLRFRVPSRQRDAGWFEALRDALLAIEGVLAVDVNPLTAGVLVLHERDTAAVVEDALRRGLFEVAPPEPPRPLTGASLRDRVNELDDRVRAATRGSLDLKSTAMAGLLGIAAVQVLRGRVLPPAAILAWWAGTLALTGPERRSGPPIVK
jgi:hypothetical protein